MGMDLTNLETLFEEARKLTGHTEFVVVGSLAALGVVQSGNVPPRMLMSIDVDCTTFLDEEERERVLRAFAEDRAR